MSMYTGTRIACIAVGTVAFVLFCACVGLPDILKAEESSGEVKIKLTAGLFRSCIITEVPGSKNTECKSYEKKKDYVEASEAFGILGALCAGVSVLLVVASLVMKNQMLLKVSLLTTLVFVVFAIICLAVFGSKGMDESDEMKLSTGMYLGIVAIVLGAGSVLTHVYALRHTGYD